MLGPGHRVASDCDSSKLDEKHLHNECNSDNCQKEPIVEETNKDIDFISKLTTVDLIENLHENETLE